jgi:hypothetical protein
MKKRKPVAQVKIGMEHIALERIAVVIMRSQSPAGIVYIFIALANLAPDRKVSMLVTPKWNVLDGVHRIGSAL